MCERIIGMYSMCEYIEALLARLSCDVVVVVVNLFQTLSPSSLSTTDALSIGFFAC